MKILSRGMLVVAIVLICYGYWGAFTRGGNKVYDEMDAYYPFFMLIAGLILLVVFLVMMMVMRRRRKE